MPEQPRANAPGFAPPADLENPGATDAAPQAEANAPGFEAPTPRHKLQSIEDYRQYFLSEMRHPTFTQSIIAEWWATSLFIFFLLASCLPGANNGQEIFRVGITAGLMIAVLVYAFYAVSGGNMNPAVSLGLVLSGRMTAPRALGYMVAQVVGAITGAAMAKFVSPTAFNLGKGGMNALQTMAIGDDTIAVTTSQGFFAEVMGTFLLVLAVLFCTDTARSIVHPHMTALIPLEIGLVVLIDHFVLMPLTGCSVNPARSIGSAVIYGNYTQLWIFIWGPFVGGAFAAAVYSLIFSPVEAFNEYFNSRNMADRAQKRLRSISDTAGAGLGAAAGAASSIAGAVGRRVGGGSQ